MRCIIASAHVSKESGIICAAGHCHTSRNKEFTSHSTWFHDTSFKADNFVYIFIRIIHGIHKPDTIIFRWNLNDRCIDIKRHLILENVIHLALFIFKDNLCTLICDLDSSSVCRKRISLFTAVKYNHICISDHIHEQRFHVCHINLISSCIHTGNLLLNAPAFRKLHLLKLTYKPHSVVLDHNTLRLMDDIHGSQTLWCQIFFILDHFHNCVCKFQFIHIIFFFAFFAKDQQSFAVNGKVLLLQCKIQESSLSAFQESRNQINGNSDIIHHIIYSFIFILILLLSAEIIQSRIYDTGFHAPMS